MSSRTSQNVLVSLVLVSILLLVQMNAGCLVSEEYHTTQSIKISLTQFEPGGHVLLPLIPGPGKPVAKVSKKVKVHKGDCQVSIGNLYPGWNNGYMFNITLRGSECKLKGSHEGEYDKITESEKIFDYTSSWTLRSGRRSNETDSYYHKLFASNTSSSNEMVVDMYHKVVTDYCHGGSRIEGSLVQNGTWQQILEKEEQRECY